MTIFKDVFSQLSLSLVYWRYYFYRAFLHLEVQFQATKLGIIWKPLSTIIGVFFIALLWTLILDRNNSFAYFYTYLLTGFVLWNYLSSAITVGCNSFLRHRVIIGNEKRPLLFYIFDTLINQFVEFLMLLLFIALIMIVTLNFTILHRIPLLAFVLFNTLIFTIGISSFMSIIVLKWRDTQQIFISLMRVMFFMTPIIWTTDRVSPYEDLLWLNPFYSHLYLFRASFMDYKLESFELIINFTLSISILFAGIWFVNKQQDLIRQKSFG